MQPTLNQCIRDLVKKRNRHLEEKLSETVAMVDAGLLPASWLERICASWAVNHRNVKPRLIGWFCIHMIGRNINVKYMKDNGWPTWYASIYWRGELAIKAPD